MSHSVGGSLRSQELGGGHSETNCCVTALVARYARGNQTGITAKITVVSHSVGGSLRAIGTRRELQRKGLLCQTALVTR